MNKTKLINEIHEGIRRAAIARSTSPQQAADFLQEGLVCALEAIERYTDKTDDELVLICSRAAYNRIADVQRREINWSRGIAFATKKVANPYDRWDSDPTYDPSENGQDDHGFRGIEDRDFIRVLAARLGAVEKRVLKEKLSPSRKVLELVRAEREQKKARREAGELVMNVHHEKVTDTHIAKAMGISKATVSRAVKRIRNEAESLSAE